MTKSIDHKINFNSGPAALPMEVLQQAAQAVINYDDTGLSILEIPHRGKHFDAILEESKQLVKELCRLDNNYEVLWLHGGGRLQFCMIPMNFLQTKAGYIESGAWAAEAADYARYYGQTEILSSSKDKNYTSLPVWPETILPDLDYVHITTNNTIYGTQWNQIPETTVPLIADMSSDIFCMKRDYKNCAMFYAVAQKNIGPAGATLAVIRKDLLAKSNSSLAPMLSYAAHAKQHSVLNTPPVFAIYVSMLMLRWTKAKGIENIEKDNRQKATMLYTEIERNSLFHCNIDPADRSIMNVCFIAKNKAYEASFLEYCEENNIVNLKGHRTTGGFRASLYNAITIDNVSSLIKVMQNFEEKINS